ncbi:MAG: hypothetical protein KF746_23295 [Chitinophagaceae bacterium]|nr:hypothetical protein [Chitinophagaceae bacterium]
MKIQLYLFLAAVLFAAQLSAQTTKNSSGLQPSDIHPDAKVIDADELYPFNKGLATVQKGNARALINSKEEFSIPYKSQYQLAIGENPEILSSNNMYFNTNGQLLIEPSCVQGYQTHSK